MEELPLFVAYLQVCFSSPCLGCSISISGGIVECIYIFTVEQKSRSKIKLVTIMLFGMHYIIGLTTTTGGGGNVPIRSVANTPDCSIRCGTVEV
jgi:hypothetical protein